MALQSKQIFVNLPVKDLNKTIEFFSSIGFEFNAQFTDDKATCMVIGDNIYAMLLVEEFFQSFIKKDIVDASRQTEVIVALSAESREQVDEIVSKAAAAGALLHEPVDHGYMYSRSFEDLDGHLWEFMHMDMSAVNPA
jgi:uncharacterized protein